MDGFRHKPILYVSLCLFSIHSELSLSRFVDTFLTLEVERTMPFNQAMKLLSLRDQRSMIGQNQPMIGQIDSAPIMMIGTFVISLTIFITNAKKFGGALGAATEYTG